VALPNPDGEGQTRSVAALVGPGGWRIEQITVIRDGVRRTVLRVRRHRYFIAEVHNIEELTGLGVDLATLIEEDDQRRRD
jgi:hypothetical protein